MALCSAHRNSPPKAVADAIQKREQASIVYPPDNNFIGDWQKGEALAQSGYGLRFTDYPARQANGGNCYACHQITKTEVSFGTLGPSLGELRQDPRLQSEADAKALYEKIYNSNAAFACSTMPRFGANKILTDRADQGHRRAADEPGQPGEYGEVRLAIAVGGHACAPPTFWRATARTLAPPSKH